LCLNIRYKNYKSMYNITYLFNADGRGKRPSGITVALVGFNDFLHIATLSVSIRTPVTLSPETLGTVSWLVALAVDANRPARASTKVRLVIVIGK
jgi:hypothetical protein